MRYVLRPAFALLRLSQGEDGRLVYGMKVQLVGREQKEERPLGITHIPEATPSPLR